MDELVVFFGRSRIAASAALFACALAAGACQTPTYKPLLGDEDPENGEGGSDGDGGTGGKGGGSSGGKGGSGGGSDDDVTTLDPPAGDDVLPSTIAFAGVKLPGKEVPSLVYDVATSPTYLYFTASEQAVVKVPRGGGSPETLFAGTVRHISVSPQDEVFGVVDPSHLSRISKDGEVTELASAQPSRTAANDASVFWIEQDADTVHTVPRAGGAETEIFRGGAFLPREIAATNDALYILVREGDFSTSPLQIRVVSPTTGAAIRTVPVDFTKGTVKGFTAAGDTIYLASYGGTPKVDRLYLLPSAGGDPITLKTDFSRALFEWEDPFSLTVDAASRTVFFQSGSQIRQIQLP